MSIKTPHIDTDTTTHPDAPDAIVVLQARLGSTRLPGKVLAHIGTSSVLARCVRRLQAAAVGPVIVATTDRSEDAALAMVARDLGVDVFRGSADDVLHRYQAATAGWTGAFVLRATADNPLVDVDGPRRVLKILRDGADYCVEHGLPVGGAVEGLRTTVLRQAAELARTPYDREHVTPYIRQRPDAFDVRVVPAPTGLQRPDLRLTIDTAEDLRFVRQLLHWACDDHPLVPLADVIAAAERRAEVPA